MFVNRQTGKENVVYKHSGDVYLIFVILICVCICGGYRQAMVYEEKSKNNLWSQFFLLAMWVLGVEHRSSSWGQAPADPSHQPIVEFYSATNKR